MYILQNRLFDNHIYTSNAWPIHMDIITEYISHVIWLFQCCANFAHVCPLWPRSYRRSHVGPQRRGLVNPFCFQLACHAVNQHAVRQVYLFCTLNYSLFIVITCVGYMKTHNSKTFSSNQPFETMSERLPSFTSITAFMFNNKCDFHKDRYRCHPKQHMHISEIAFWHSKSLSTHV